MGAKKSLDSHNMRFGTDVLDPVLTVYSGANSAASALLSREPVASCQETCQMPALRCITDGPREEFLRR